jgi:hypothetical protein
MLGLKLKGEYQYINLGKTIRRIQMPAASPLTAAQFAATPFTPFALGLTGSHFRPLHL